MTDYGTIQPLCDAKGCSEPQTGDIVEMEIDETLPPIWVRVHPCSGHRDKLFRGGRRWIVVLVRERAGE